MIIIICQLCICKPDKNLNRLLNKFRCDGFEISEEANACSALISAYESGDDSRFQQVLQQPLLRSMDNEVHLSYLFSKERSCSVLL